MPEVVRRWPVRWRMSTKSLSSRRKQRGVRHEQDHWRHHEIAAQVPGLFEKLSGMPLSELLGKVRQISDKPPKPPVVDAAK